MKGGTNGHLSTSLISGLSEKPIVGPRDRNNLEEEAAPWNRAIGGHPLKWGNRKLGRLGKEKGLKLCLVCTNILQFRVGVIAVYDNEAVYSVMSQSQWQNPKWQNSNMSLKTYEKKSMLTCPFMKSYLALTWNVMHYWACYISIKGQQRERITPKINKDMRQWS